MTDTGESSPDTLGDRPCATARKALILDHLPPNALAWGELARRPDGVRRILGHLEDPCDALRIGVLRGLAAACLLEGPPGATVSDLRPSLDRVSGTCSRAVVRCALVLRIVLGDERPVRLLPSYLVTTAHEDTMWGVLALGALDSRGARAGLGEVAARLRWEVPRSVPGRYADPEFLVPEGELAPSGWEIATRRAMFLGAIAALAEVGPPELADIVHIRSAGALTAWEREAWAACELRLRAAEDGEVDDAATAAAG